jgi:Ca2+-transporting ATPase
MPSRTQRRPRPDDRLPESAWVGASLSLPGCPGPGVVVRHARAARRLRLEVAGLRGSLRRARALEDSLRGVRGIAEVRADSRSGRVLIRYAPGAPFLRELRSERTEGASRAGHPRPAARAPEASRAWHALPAERVLDLVGSRPGGIDTAEARRRLAEVGANEPEPPPTRSRLGLLASQVANLPSAMLLGGAGIAALARDLIDSGAILATLGLDAVIGYRIERKNEDLLASWRRLDAGEARVIRDGRIATIPAYEVVPGDVLVVRAGDSVPADARVIDAHRLGCNEAILTGESEPSAKTPEPVPEQAALAERSCMLFAGTAVASGRGRAVVTATGANVQAAQVCELVAAQTAPRTPFERKLDALGRDLTLAGVGAAAAAAAAGLLRGRPLRRVADNAVALAVAAIPEGLPVVSTAALVQSMSRLRGRGMVVRRLVSAEALGGVTVVCADKTGTLTRNEMRLACLDVGGGPIEAAGLRADPGKVLEDPVSLALAASVLNSDVEVETGSGSFSVAGSSTERALLEAATEAGLARGRLVRDFPRRLLRERRADAHFVVSAHDAPGGGGLAFVKGAPEQVLALCASDLRGPLDAGRRAEILARNHAMADRGLRVLAVAWRRLSDGEPRELLRGHIFVALLGLRDPLRPGAAEAVRAASRAGIRTVILTGDQRRTAEAIARAVGLEGEVVDGPEMAKLLRTDGPEPRARLARAAVFARVTPADKAELIRALRELGEVVAMAGDGVNDAPALKAADVGIAIGRGASDVSREAADIVLESEDLGSILHAVGEGRVVQDNLRRALRFLLATNLAEVVLTLGAALVGARDPFTATRLLWLNLISDTLPAMALALEPAQDDVLRRPPAPPGTPLFAGESRRLAVRDGLGLALLGAASFAAGPAAGFHAMAGAELGYSLACRAPGSAPEPRFLSLLGGAAAMHAATLFVPPIRSLLRLPGPFSFVELAAFGAGTLVPFVASGGSRDAIVVRSGRAKEVRP